MTYEDDCRDGLAEPSILFEHVAQHNAGAEQGDEQGDGHHHHVVTRVAQPYFHHEVVQGAHRQGIHHHLTPETPTSPILFQRPKILSTPTNSFFTSAHPYIKYFITTSTLNSCANATHPVLGNMDSFSFNLQCLKSSHPRHPRLRQQITHGQIHHQSTINPHKKNKVSAYLLLQQLWLVTANLDSIGLPLGFLPFQPKMLQSAHKPLSSTPQKLKQKTKATIYHQPTSN
jgi:hypothetical protein